MPCSAAIELDFRRDSTTMPVSAIVRPLYETTDYSRSKISTTPASCSIRRASGVSKQSSYTTDTSRYTYSRSSFGLRSTSLSDDTRDRSQTREYSRLSRESSRSRLSSYTGGSSAGVELGTKGAAASGARRTPSSSAYLSSYTTSDLDEFRATYSPSNYITGSSRSAESGTRPPRPPPPLGTTSASDPPPPRIKPTAASVGKDKRAEAAGVEALSNATVSEVNRDENHNVREESRPKEEAEEVVKGGEALPAEAVADEEAAPSTEVKNRIGAESKERSASPPAPNRAQRQQEYSPRITRTTYGARRDLPTTTANDNNGLSGLRNIGNTCFLNSVVQCLSNTRLLKDYLLSREYIGEITNTESRGVLIKSFADVICELWSGEGKIVNTTAFKAQIQKYAPRFMGYNQQDAQEFLRYLLQGLHDDINRVAIKPRNLPQIDDNLSDTLKASESWKQYLRIDNSRIVDLFVGQLKSTLQCTVCGHCSTTFEVFWDLSLPLPSRSGSHRLQQCLDHFTKEEVLDGDEMPTCSQCKTRRKCTKRFSIQKFPKILVLHLKRFSPSERYRKLSATVEFPLTNLDMSAYSSTPQASSYNLYAVSNHSGTAYSGHYTAYCSHPHSGQWHEYNDSRVCSVSSRNVVSSEAYILFYEQTTGVTSRL